MSTFAQTIAAFDQRWSWLVLIDGVGLALSNGNLALVDSDGRIRWCISTPDYADNSTNNWREYLTALPQILPERPDPLGGLPEKGELSFSILDVNNELTSLIRPEANPVTALAEDLDSSETLVDVEDGSAYSNISLLFIGSECMRVTSVSTNTLTVLRGYLGTDAVSHKEGDSCFTHCNYLKNRRVTLKLVPTNADDAGEEQTEVTAVIDTCYFDPLFSTWHFAAITQLKYLDRIAPLEPRSATAHYGPDIEGNLPHEFTISFNEMAPVRPIWTTNTDHLFFLKNGDEVTGVTVYRSEVGIYPRAASIKLGGRGLLGTSVEDLDRNHPLFQVMISDISLESDFRYSPGPTPSEDRTSGTWTKTDHWVDLILCIMLSSAHPDDNLELVNYETAGTDFARSNFSSLPIGYGLGLPSALVDWTSWESVRQRTADCRFPRFVYGAEPMPFGELVAENFLRPLGAYIIFRDGLAKIVLPRTPLLGESTITLGASDILAREVGRNVYEPRIAEATIDLSHTSGSVIYYLGPNELPLTVSSGSYTSTYGQRGYYGDSDKPVEVTVPGASEGDQHLWLRKATNRLARRHRPRLSMLVDTGLENYSAGPGDFARVTLNEVPDFRTGTRDWSSVPSEILEREIISDEEDGVYARWRLLGYGSDQRVARIAPSAIIESFVGDVATVAANRFTSADALNGLPTTDAAAFTVGDLVRLVDLTGAALTSTGAGSPPESIDGISGNDITLSGDFGGLLAADTILVFADAAEADTPQYESFAFMGARNAAPAVAGSIDLYEYGEP